MQSRKMSRSDLLAALLGAMPFAIFAVPFEVGEISANLLASVVALTLASLWLNRRYREFLHQPFVSVWLVAIGFFGLANATFTGTDFWDILTTLRYTTIAPLSLFIMGYCLTRKHGDAPVLALVPGALISIVFMALAFQNPFVGELKPGHWVGERSRFYLHPLSGDLIWPVTIAESCTAAFAMFWFLFSERRVSRWLIYAPLAFSAMAISIAGATRSYLFAIAAVFGIMVMRTLIIQRKYREVIAVVSMLAALAFTLVFNDSFREFAMTRLDRFKQADLFDNSERMMIWNERAEYALDSGLIDGLSMRQYWSMHEISSHNLYFDWVIIGGWAYGVIIGGGTLILAIWAGIRLIRRRESEYGSAQACAFLTMFLVIQVSSPIISSLAAYSLLWYLAGMLVASQNAQNRRLPSSVPAIVTNDITLDETMRNQGALHGAR